VGYVVGEVKMEIIVTDSSGVVGSALADTCIYFYPSEESGNFSPALILTVEERQFNLTPLIGRLKETLAEIDGLKLQALFSECVTAPDPL